MEPFGDTMKKLPFVVIAVIGLMLLSLLPEERRAPSFDIPQSTPRNETPAPVVATRNNVAYTPQLSASDQVLRNAFNNRQSNLQVEGVGTVSRLLPDDRGGSQHQKFLIRLASGQTLLISHNIDIAPRLNALRVGDMVQFWGEYEWNEKGGVIHWTHHDPNGRHVTGGLQHKGASYY
jgi:hypothetical protein